MNSFFDPEKGTWQVDWPGRVSKHDLVYLSPPSDPLQGLAIGNGEIGVLAWCEGSKLIFAVNKSDLWDDAKSRRFRNWAAEEEEFSTTLRHACRIILDFNMPVFDLFYLSDFKGRLNLAEASLELSVAGPFGSVAGKFFVSHQDGIFCGEVHSKLTENLPLEIKLERFGSRTFSHWYYIINRDPQIGIKGTRAYADKEGAYITHSLTSGIFAVGATVLEGKGINAEYHVENSHTAGITVTGGKSKKFTFLAAVTSPISGPPVAVVKQQLSAVQKERIGALRDNHQKAWKAFWLQSLLEFGDDYLDNLWHLTMFYAACSQGGKSPGRFIHGLWAWNRDAQPWNFYFHWNQKDIYWPLNAAGHHGLIDSYLNYRFNSLPHARSDAREVCGTDGAVISDVCERRGYNSASEFDNHTPVAQIALEFYRQYRYTGDVAFLKTRALPFLLEAARFFESLFEKENDGLYHAKAGTGYEGCIKLKDGITELVYAKVLFATTIKVLTDLKVREPRAGKWQDIIDHLVPLPMIKGDREILDKKKLKRGFFKGQLAAGNRFFAAGFGILEKKILCSFIPCNDTPPHSSIDMVELIAKLEDNKTPYSALKEDMKCYDGIFPSTEFSVVYPSGLVGLAEKGSSLFNAAVNTAKLYSPDCMGLDPLPVVLARLGLGDELSQILSRWPSRWQYFCNGFGNVGPRDLAKADVALRFRTNTVRDASLSEAERNKTPFSFPAWPFRHIDLGPMSVLAMAMNEALMQSYDGVIRVAPAATRGQNARFTLHAQDGFIISAEIQNGAPLWIAVKGLQGKCCRLEIPWPRACLYHRDKKERTFAGKIIEFPTVRNGQYILVPSDKVWKNWKVGSTSYRANESPKKDASGYALLGQLKLF